MGNIILNLETSTKSEIINAANLQPELMAFLGEAESIKNRCEDSLRCLLSMYFALNTEVGAFYNKNGF